MHSNFLFHGTSLKNAKAILENGFDGSEGEQIWSVSAKANYFWSMKDLCKAEGQSPKENPEFVRDRAMESGLYAVTQTDCSHVVVFMISGAGVNYEPDQSCPYMDGAVVSQDLIPADKILKMWMTNDLTYFKPFIVAAELNWKANLRITPDYHPALLAAGEAIQKSKVEFYYNDYIEMEETTKREILNM